MKKPILLDVMLNNHFVCQLKYDKQGFPALIDGNIVEQHNIEDLERFVEEKRPSLKGKPYTIAFSNQKIITT